MIGVYGCFISTQLLEESASSVAMPFSPWSVNWTIFHLAGELVVAMASMSSTSIVSGCVRLMDMVSRFKFFFATLGSGPDNDVSNSWLVACRQDVGNFYSSTSYYL